MFNNQMIQNNNKKKIIIILKKMIKVILMQLYKLVKDGYQIQNINTIQIFKTKKEEQLQCIWLKIIKIYQKNGFINLNYKIKMDKLLQCYLYKIKEFHQRNGFMIHR